MRHLNEIFLLKISNIEIKESIYREIFGIPKRDLGRIMQKSQGGLQAYVKEIKGMSSDRP